MGRVPSSAAQPRILAAVVALAVLVGALGVGDLGDLPFGPDGATQLVLGAGPGFDAVAGDGGSGSAVSVPPVGLIDSVESAAPGSVTPGSVDGDARAGRGRTGSNAASGLDAAAGLDGDRAAKGPGPVASSAAGVGTPPGAGEGRAEADPGPTIAGSKPPCVVVAAPRSLGLSSYYEKACVVAGIPVVASAAVADPALVAAARVVEGMLANRPDLVAELVARRFRLGIIGVGQRAIELPEYRDLPVSYPDTDWDAARAYGATPSRPLAAVPEENLLCLPEDTYPGQSVLAHELGHSVLDMAVLPNNPAFEDRLRVAFRAAADNPVYRNTYAMTNVDEYWGEGVQDFFDASREAHGPGGGGDGYDGPIFSRATLRQHDPVLHAMIAGVFTEVSWRPTCP